MFFLPNSKGQLPSAPHVTWSQLRLHAGTLSRRAPKKPFVFPEESRGIGASVSLPFPFPFD